MFLDGCDILEEALAVVLEVYGIFGGRAVFWRGVTHFGRVLAMFWRGVAFWRRCLQLFWRGVAFLEGASSVLEDGLAVF